MWKYFLIIILLLGVLYGLNRIFLMVMSKFGPQLAERFGGSEKKGKKDIEINHNCLIIAFILFAIVIMPSTNNILFFFMAILYAIRSLNGKLTIGRGIAFFVGVFFIGIMVSNLTIGMINVLPSLILSSIAIPLLIFGFIKSKKTGM